MLLFDDINKHYNAELVNYLSKEKEMYEEKMYSSDNKFKR